MKERLNCVNQLLADVYERDIRISSLLADYLDAAQLKCIKVEKLDAFLSMMLFGVRCRFVAITEGMRLYSILSARYGLEDAFPRTLAQIGEIEGVSRERIRQLEQKALKRLKPTKNYDALKHLACLAAREVLDIEALPAQPESSEGAEPNDQPFMPVLTAEKLETILITDSMVTLKELHENINSAVGAERGNPGHIRLSTLKNWMLENGALEMISDINGKKSARPTELGKRLGIDLLTRDSKYGAYTVTMYSRSAQEFLRDSLSTIVSWNEEVKTNKNAASNQGAPWTLELDEQLKRRFVEGATQNELANEMGRSSGGIRARLKKHGLIDVDEESDGVR